MWPLEIYRIMAPQGELPRAGEHERRTSSKFGGALSTKHWGGAAKPSTTINYLPNQPTELPLPRELPKTPNMDIRDRKPLKTRYLILYNTVSAILWLAILCRVVLLVPLVGFKNVYGGVGEFVKWTQTLAALEVVHAAFGEFPKICVLFYSTNIRPLV